MMVKKPEDEEEGHAHTDETLSAEMENLKKLQDEKEKNMDLLTEKYDQLQEQHIETLDLVEELKAEVAKARMTSDSTSPTTPVIRRKSSQNVMVIDREH